jgi:hypothetical protein
MDFLLTHSDGDDDDDVGDEKDLFSAEGSVL